MEKESFVASARYCSAQQTVYSGSARAGDGSLGKAKRPIEADEENGYLVAECQAGQRGGVW